MAIDRKRPSLDDVAELAGVSRSTASLVLNGAPGPGAASRAAVTDAAARLNYRPDRSARSLASGRSRLIGVLFSTRDSFHADLIDEIYPAAETRGYEVVLSAVVPGRNEQRAFDALVDSRCAAVIQLGSAHPGDRGFTYPVPTVAVGWRSDNPLVDSVRTADAVGTGAAVDHLVGLGHKDILHIDAGRRAGSTERRRGYRTAMRVHGLTDYIRIARGDYTEDRGVRVVEQLLAADDLPTAIVAANDRTAHGALDTLRRAGIRVPDDVSVIGYDDSLISRLSHVDLSTVRQDAASMATAAVDAAVSRIDDGRTDQRELLLEPLLLERATTAVASDRRLLRTGTDRIGP